jgi:hypothetical protein
MPVLGEDWLMRPITRGMVQYDGILAGSPLTLEDFARMNDAIDVLDENKARWHDANRPDRGRP